MYGLNSPDHDVERNDGGNDAAFDVIIDGKGEDHRDDENLLLMSFRSPQKQLDRNTHKSQAV